MLQNVPVTNSASKTDSTATKESNKSWIGKSGLEHVKYDQGWSGVFKLILPGQIIASSSLASLSYIVGFQTTIQFYFIWGWGGRGGSTNFSDFSVTFLPNFFCFFFGDVQVDLCVCVVPDLYTQTVFSLPYQLLTKSFQKWSCQKLENLLNLGFITPSERLLVQAKNSGGQF